MSGGFVKIYGSILDSSIWATDIATRVVWVALLTMADRHGVVAASVDGIARRANVSEEQVSAALTELQLPDPKSKSRAHRGRRLRQVDGGWLILNYTKYRELQTEKQVQAAQRARRYRERHAESVTNNAHHAPSREKTPEVEANADTDTTTPPKAVPAKRPEYDQVFVEAWAAYPKRPNNSKPGAYRQWLLRVGEGVDALDMLEGTRRYARFVEAEGTEPRFVKHAETFFGRDRHFENDFTPSIPRDPLAERVKQQLEEDAAAEQRTAELLAKRKAS